MWGNMLVILVCVAGVAGIVVVSLILTNQPKMEETEAIVLYCILAWFTVGIIAIIGVRYRKFLLKLFCKQEEETPATGQNEPEPNANASAEPEHNEDGPDEQAEPGEDIPLEPLQRNQDIPLEPQQEQNQDIPLEPQQQNPDIVLEPIEENEALEQADDAPVPNGRGMSE